MEKAKLFVSMTKNNKIEAKLEFPNGKKMPVQNLNLKDITLDGSEVDVEREKGQIVLIKKDDKTLFSRQTSSHIDLSRSKMPLKLDSQPKDSSMRSYQQTSTDRQDQHISNVRNPAYAPYNFVPLNGKVVEINSCIPPMNKYHKERNTGWIDLEIKAITPLYIRGTLTRDDIIKELDSKDKSDFYAPIGRIRIPGSSLRGMIRNMVEIVSFGKFSFFEDKRLYYRGLADQSSLRGEYQRNMSISDRQSRKPKYQFLAGVLQKSNTRERGLHYEIKSSGSSFKQILKSDAQKRVQEINEEYGEFKYYKLADGFLVVSGDIPQKKRDWLISYPPDNADIIPIPDKDIQSYNEDRTRDSRVPNLLGDAKSGKEVPCFFVRWKDERGEERISFGHTGFFRLAYEKTIGEHIPEALKDVSKIDFTEAIFGNEKTHSGRIFFEDAFLVNEHDDPQLNVQIPRILSAPKPTTFQHYLVQNSDEAKELNHYNSKASIRGYKLYWHKSGEKWAETDTKAIAEHSTQYIEKGIRPVKPGTDFHGRIRFENLSDEELGALLFALDLPQGCGHKLGMGKPLGLGSIHITPKLYLSDRQARYRDLFSEWDNNLVESDQLQGKKLKFERYVLDELGEIKGQTLWNTDRLQELLIMLRFDVGNDLEEKKMNRYMRIEPQNEFKNRYVLRNASSLVPTSKIEEILAQLHDEKSIVF